MGLELKRREDVPDSNLTSRMSSYRKHDRKKVRLRCIIEPRLLEKRVHRTTQCITENVGNQELVSSSSMSWHMFSRNIFCLHLN